MLISGSWMLHKALAVGMNSVSYTHLDGVDIYDASMNVVDLRTKVGMVFQKPNPFPMSIYDNIAYGPRCQGIKKRKILDNIVAQSLKKAALWDEVKDRLQDSALGMRCV